MLCRRGQSLDLRGTQKAEILSTWLAARQLIMLPASQLLLGVLGMLLQLSLQLAPVRGGGVSGSVPVSARPPPPPPPPPVLYGFRFATTHSDNMVLQAAPLEAVVWGFVPAAAARVQVCLGPAACVDAALAAGPAGSGARIFTAVLPKTAPSAVPVNISAAALASGGAGSGKEAWGGKIWLRSIVFGDVYVCSGQSNMDFAVPMGFNATAEGADADAFPDIRLYTVQKCGGGSPHACVRRGPGPALEFLNASFSGQRWVPASKASVYGAEPWGPQDYRGWEAKIGQTAGGKGFSAACWSVHPQLPFCLGARVGRVGRVVGWGG